ncbi:hypothetical protein ACIGD1_32675 [Streptomyces sp. NPDC085612]|uniref:hypothetical protein n=1 Tax=Streptomyces sp. NPDC085612 TaxID=3365732 RepID=UPI0037D756F7
MNTQPPPRDPRARDHVLDHADMHDLVADLALPGGASMYVMSALETSRELIRHSSYRYEFATVAVTHSLFALERVLAERLATNEPLHALIERATGTGLITAELAAELDRGRMLRDRLGQGAESSAALRPLRAERSPTGTSSSARHSAGGSCCAASALAPTAGPRARTPTPSDR